MRTWQRGTAFVRIAAICALCGGSDALLAAERRLDKEVVVAAPPEEVWRAWTTSEGIAKFFTPESKIELRLGGPYELYMGMKPDAQGQRGSEGCKVLSFIPQEMLSFEWNFPPKVAALREAGAKTHVVLRFEDLGESRTRVKFTQLGWQEGPDWDQGYAYFDQAWSRVMEQLKEKIIAPQGQASFSRPSRADVKIIPGESEKRTGVLRHQGIVDAPLAEVWKAWTTQEGIESWMVAHAQIDLRIGGKMLTHYDPQGTLGDPNTIENTILSFEPNRMFSIRATNPPEKFPFKEVLKDMWTVIYFDESGADRTLLTIVGMGFRDDELSQKMREHFDKGNAWTLKKLQQKFAPNTSAAPVRE